jgi:hypothetical protein
MADTIRIRNSSGRMPEGLPGSQGPPAPSKLLTTCRTSTTHSVVVVDIITFPSGLAAVVNQSNIAPDYLHASTPTLLS